MIKAFSDTILLPTKRDVLKFHISLMLAQKQIKASDADIDVMIELYEFGGYNNSTEQESFIKSCIDKNLRKSKQSVRNTLSKYVGLGVFKKKKNTVLHISEDYLPKVDCSKLVLLHKISHAE